MKRERRSISLHREQSPRGRRSAAPTLGLSNRSASRSTPHSTFTSLTLQRKTISEFAAGATGNVAPIRMISGPNTGLRALPPSASSFAEGIAVSARSGQTFVANPSTNSILVFAANANGNIAPIQTIAGSATGLNVPLNLTLEE